MHNKLFVAALSQSQFASPGSAGKNSACAGSVTSLSQARVTLPVSANQFGSEEKLTQKSRQQGMESKHDFLFRFLLTRRGEVH